MFCYTQTILSRKSINAGIYLYEHNEVQHLFQDSFLSISGAIRPLESGSRRWRPRLSRC